MATAEASCLFFYGTLLHPSVIKRVTGQDVQNLRIQPAVLLNYTRHHVKECDYPAIIPFEEARALIGKDLPREEKCVRGNLVYGLSQVDQDLLDVFEGDEYKRELVKVYPLALVQPLSTADGGDVCEPFDLPSEFHHAVNAHTYVWAKGIDTLDSKIWSYETFVKEKLTRWLDGEGGKNYEGVDAQRTQEALSNTTATTPRWNEAAEAQTEKVEQENRGEFVFGRGMRKWFGMDPSYINLNNGSYGTTPLPVLEAVHEIEKEIESNPDLFMKVKLKGYLDAARHRLATFVGAENDEVVFVQNVTTGINIVLQNFRWKKDDILVGFATSYGAISNTLRYHAEKEPHPKLSIINLTFPSTPQAVIQQFKDHLESLPKLPDHQIVAVIDSISANPGMALPWEEMTRIARGMGVWTLIDGAHTVGQLPLDVKKADPDFFVLNCHKWLYAKRATGMLYVPKRNHQHVRATLPISWGYVSPPGPVTFVEQFDWSGTIDHGPFMSVNAALDFRERIGGERSIQEYCHRVAREGGRKAAEILGTDLMDERNEFTASMVDIRLPLPAPVQPEQSRTLSVEIQLRLLKNWHCSSSVYTHNGKLWTRASVQIWSEVSDFEYLANALKSICADLAPNYQPSPSQPTTECEAVPADRVQQE